MMKTTDKIIAAPRSTLQQALTYAAKFRFPNGDKAVKEYLEEVYRLAPLVNVDPALVVSQSVHETTEDGVPWSSHWWNTRLNPAGIGITGDPAQNAQSHTWANGTDAARSQVGHLLVYSRGPSDAGSLWHRKAEGVDQPLSVIDPRYEAYVDAFGNVARAQTIADLAGTWAADTQYHTKIVAKAAAIFGDLPAQENGGPSPMPDKTVTIVGLGPVELDVPFEVHILPLSQPNQRPGRPMTPDRYVLHETGNTRPGANADAERGYLEQGAPDQFGRSQQLSYHFTVDDRKIIQLLPVNEVAWHGGDGAGPCNFGGIACELCVGSTVNWNLARINAAKLAAAVTKALGDIPVKQHNSCSGKDCPHFMRAEGYWPTYLANVLKFKSAIDDTPDEPPATYAKPDIPDWLIEDRDKVDLGQAAPGDHDYKGVPVFGCLREYVAVRDTPRLQLFSRKSERVGPDIEKGTRFTAMYWATSGQRRYVLTEYGTRFDMGDLTPYLTIRERA